MLSDDIRFHDRWLTFSAHALGAHKYHCKSMIDPLQCVTHIDTPLNYYNILTCRVQSRYFEILFCGSFENPQSFSILFYSETQDVIEKFYIFPSTQRSTEEITDLYNWVRISHLICIRGFRSVLSGQLVRVPLLVIIKSPFP